MMIGQEDSKVMNPDCPVIYTSLSVSIINNSVVISHPKVYIYRSYSDYEPKSVHSVVLLLRQED